MLHVTIEVNTLKLKGKRKTYTMIVKRGWLIIHTRTMSLKKIKRFKKSYESIVTAKTCFIL